jgi:adenylate cyclase
MNLRVKLFLGIVTIAFLASGATGSYFYLQAKNTLFHSLRQELKASAIIASQLIDGETLQGITEPKHRLGPDYKKIQSILGTIAQTNQEFLYAYTMRLHNDHVEFIVDSPASDDNSNGIIDTSELPAPTGEVYPNPPPKLLQGFIQPAADTQPWQDQWGWTLSGYAPIFNSQGQRVGLIGIDMDITRVAEKLKAIRQAGYVSLSISFVLALILTFYFTKQIVRPLRYLQKGLESISQGDYTVQLHQAKNDEIGRVIASFNLMIQGLREKEFLKSSLGKVVNKEVAEHLVHNRLQLGGEVVQATILFCDLRGFTNLSTKLPPSLLVSLLNEYFTAMVTIIEKNGGIVDKFVGDAIMAVFGHPQPLAHEQDLAFQTAIQMIEECSAINRRLQLSPELTLTNSIGIHTGYVLAGNIGSPERMEYTCIGDAVNVASRLEQLTRKLHTRLVLSSQLVKQLSDTKEKLVNLGEHSLHGRKESIVIYALKNNDSPLRSSQNSQSSLDNSL